jgi:glycosyltransferase involved in cell wall biosynthesis/tetratricopeptide (TPR) repeat protein
MTKKTLIVLATAWGPKHGGINSFNYDFVNALGVAFHDKVDVFCVVPNATAAEIKEARHSFVTLVRPENPPQGEILEASYAAEIVRRLGDVVDANTVWIGHDLFTGEAAVEAAAQTRSRAALLNHMSYLAYKAFQSGSAQQAHEKSRRQQAMFERADWLFAVGPLLRDELSDLVRGSQPHMIVPGLPEIEPVEPPKRWTMVLFGRLNPETDRIKQGRLGVAAFARAYRDAWDQPGQPAALREGRLKLFGVDARDETELRVFAAEAADAVVDIHPLPFETDRKVLLTELAGASVAVMPSWHEGFGLVGWEAIGAGVPLVLGIRSGLYRFLDETLTGAGTGCVQAVQIRGSEDPDAPYQDRDVVSISDALKRLAADGERATRNARKLRELLSEYTWARCARQFVQDIGWDIQQDVLPAPTLAVPERAALAPSPVAIRPEQQLLTLPVPAWRAGHGYAESLLLRAEEACVPFDPGRDGLVSDLLAWAGNAEGFPLMVRLHTGPGGIGKTRLLLEVCRKLGPDWRAGFLVGDCPVAEIPTRLTPLLRQHAQVLIVVDYAETRRAEVAALVEAALPSPDRRVRIVLLARDAGEWWDRLATDYPNCERIFAGTASSGPYPLPPLHVGVTDRDAAYFAALKEFAARLGIADVEAHAQARPDLSADHFGSPLYVQMAALLALRGERSGTASGLTDGLLRHEEHYWSRLGAANGIPDGGRAATYLLALATLSGGIATAREARHLYESSDGPACDNAALQTLFRLLSQLYPGRQGLHPLRPDVLGERLVARVLALAGDSRATILSALLGSKSNEAVRRHTLTVMTRLAQHSPDARPVLLEALQAHFVPCVGPIVEVSLETGQPLPEVSVAAFESLPSRLKAQASGLLSGRIPHPSVKLAELALRLAEFLLAGARTAGEHHRADEKSSADLAASLGNTGVRLEDLGRLEEALERTREAHAIHARLATARPDRYEADLAMSLNNLGFLLGELGRFEEALERALEAHAIYVRLAAARPDRYEADLAMCLNNLGIPLSELGRFEEALARVGEAHAIYARLAAARPDRYEADLAMSLSSLGTRLSALGRSEEALARAREAAAIRARLAAAQPDRYETDLAASLSNLGARLSELGRSEEALARAGESYAIYARLAAARPDRYEADLAASLSNLGNHLSEMGRFEEALVRAGEAHAIYPRLAAARPDRYEADLALSLNNLGVRLSELGRSEEALARAREAHASYARLAELNPLRYAYGLLSSELWLQFLAWHAGLGDRELLATWPERARQTELPARRRELLVAWHAMVEGCFWDRDRAGSGIEKMEAVVASFAAMAPHQRRPLEPYHLIAAAYLTQHAPNPERTAAYGQAWRNFLDAHGNRMPGTVTETLKRLNCASPAGH